MPTYEYACKNCGNSFEIFQSMKDEPLKVCPECGREIRRIINGGGGVIFKGSGFYVTDAKPKGGAADVKPADAKSAAEPSADKAAANSPPADAKKNHEEKAAG